MTEHGFDAYVSCGDNSNIERSCLFWDQQALRVDFNKKVALSHGVTGTPTFFIIGPNGDEKKVVGSQPSIIFESVIKEIE